MREAAPDEKRTAFGWRELLGAVNLTDFAQMVGAEISQIVSNVRLAFRSMSHLPVGPLVFFPALLMAALRTMLLFLVVAAFGGAILAITIVRAAARAISRILPLGT